MSNKNEAAVLLSKYCENRINCENSTVIFLFNVFFKEKNV